MEADDQILSCLFTAMKTLGVKLLEFCTGSPAVLQKIFNKK